MSDRTVRAVLELQVSNFVANANRAASALDSLAKNGAKAQALDRVGNTLLGVGAATLAGVGIATKAYADFDAQMSAVKAATGETAAGMDLLREAALKAGADTKYNASEAAQGIEQLAKAGLSTSDILKGGLTGSLDLAAAGEMAVADAAEVTSTTLQQFHLAGSQAAHVADLLAAGANKAVGDVSDLAMALKQSGTVAAQYGVSVEDTVGVLAMFASNAAIGSDAGTMFKTMLMRLAAPTAEAKATMDRLGLSMYDANGNFVGIESAAGQLQERLSGLSQEQRNAALQAIFGQDAIRGAMMLYEGGSGAVAKWSSAVNDSGFAAQMAATRMDNLKGDLEQLGGSIETTFIRLGESSNAGLRSAVQSVTGLVNAVGDLPQGVQTGLMGTATALGAITLAAGGAAKATVAVAELKAAMDALGISAKRAMLSFGLIGVAMLAAGAAIAKYGQNAYEAQQAAQSYADAIRGQSDAINENTRELAFNNLQQSGALDAARALGISLRDVTDAALGSAEAQQRVRAAQEAALAANRNNLDESIKVGQAIGDQNRAFEDGKSKAGQYEEAMAGTAAAAGTASAAQSGLSTSTSDAASAMDVAGQAARDMASAFLAASGSQIGMEAAIDAAAEAAKRNGRALDVNTAKGRENRGALNSLASATLGYVDSLDKVKAPASQVNAAIGRGRSQFVAQARAMGMTRSEAQALADKYGLVKRKIDTIPGSKKTNVSAPGASAATSQVNTFRSRVDGIAARKTTTITASASTRAAEAALNYTARTRRSTVIQTVNVQRAKADGGIDYYSGGSLVQAYADGGMRYAGSLASGWPQIAPTRPGGILWAEDTRAPWEAFISGDPAKAARSREIAEMVVGHLGGQVAWARAFADGGLITRNMAAPRPASSQSLAGLGIDGTLTIPGLGDAYVRGIVRDELGKDRAHATHDRRRLTGRR